MAALQEAGRIAQAKSADERRFYREQLENMLRTKSSKVGGMFPDSFADATRKKYFHANGDRRLTPLMGEHFEYGVSPSESDLDRFIAQQKGGRSNISRGTNMGLIPGKTTKTARDGQLSRAAGTKEKKEAETDLQKFFREAEGKIEEANTANESRYQAILKDLDSRYNRVMDRIQNFGHAARSDLQEQASEALGNIHANLSARGMGNSTIFAAFQQRNARDLARERQRLSEVVDTRAMNADMQMTGDKAAFMERKSENAPDYGQLMELSAKYGIGNEGRGFKGGGEQQQVGPNITRNDYRQQQGGGGSIPPGAVTAGRNTGPKFLNGYNPMQILNNMAGMGASRRPWNAPVNKGAGGTNVADPNDASLDWDAFNFTGGIDYSNAVNMTDLNSPVQHPDPSRAGIGDPIYREQMDRVMQAPGTYPFPKDPGMIPPPTVRTPQYNEAEDLVNSWRSEQMPMHLGPPSSYQQQTYRR